MKKIFCLILTLTLLLNSFVISCFATEEEYKTISTEFSDKKGSVESLDVMVVDSNVYIDAHQLGERLGYEVSLTKNENGVVVFADGKGDIPRMLAVFYFDSNEVEYLVLNAMQKYETPFNAVKNDKGIWIPFKYAVFALNSSMLIINDVVTITMPQNTLLNTMLLVSQDMNTIKFDYHSDMMFTDGDMALQTATSRIVNLFSGILEFEGESWLLMFQQFLGDTSAYDNKFADELATLFCTNSDKELEALNEQIDILTDVFSTDGKLGTALNEINTNINTTVDDLYAECNKLFKTIDESNANVSKYNATYEQFEKAFNKQTTFTQTGQAVMDVQGGLDSVTKKLSVLGEVLEVTGYMSEYSDKDDYSVQSIIEYINAFENVTLLPEAFVTSLKSNAEIINSNIVEYSVYKYIENNYTDWIQSGLQIGQQMGAQANIALLAWNIASATIPFIKNGLDSAENFELSMYAYALQQDSFINYVDFRQHIFANIHLLTDENLFKLAQYLYTYLKSAYITRDAAIGSFANHKDNPDSQDVLKMWDAPNEIVAEYLAETKMISENNLDGTIGFTPDRNKWVVNNYSDEDLLVYLKNSKNISKENTSSNYIDSSIPSFYDSVLTMYYESIISNWANCDEDGWDIVGDPDNASYIFWHFEKKRTLSEVGYCLLDINDDNQPELFVSLFDIAGSGSFYDMYTINNDEVVHTISAGERDRYNLANDLSINNVGSGSALNSSNVNYRLDSTGGVLKVNQAVIYDGWEDNENPYFYATSDYYNEETYEYNYDALKPISNDEALMLLESFPDNKPLELIPFSEYKNQDKKLPASSKSEAELKNLLKNEGIVSAWEYADYDSDGDNEAFAIITDEEGVVQEILFVSSEGQVTVVENNIKLLFYKSEDGNIRYTHNKGFFWADIGAGGSGWQTLLYSVKNDNPYKLKLSNNIQGFYQEGNIFYTTENKFLPEGGHLYPKIELIYDSNTQEFAKGTQIPETNTQTCITQMQCIDYGWYTGNMGDSCLFSLDKNGLYNNNADNAGYYRNGNIGLDGTEYHNGFEAFLARWNPTAEISYCYATYKLNGKYKSLTGKTSLIKSANTNNFNTSVYFYNGDILLASYTLTNDDYEKDIYVDVTGVDELKILVQDNIAVKEGTSYALYDMFLT